VAGNTVWMRYTAGAMTTAGGNNVSIDGTAALPIRYLGYNTVRGDAPTGDNRPTVSHANSWYLTDYSNLENVIWTGNYSSAALIIISITNTAGIVRNCKITNTGSGATAVSITGTAAKINYIDNCDITVPASGKGVNNTAILTNCYVHGSGTGIGVSVTAASSTIKGNVISGCATGVSMFTAGNVVMNSTIYNCTTGIDCGTQKSNKYIGNLIDTCTTGITKSTSNDPSNLSNYNVFSNNGTDVTNVTKGPNDVTGNASLNTTTFAVAAGSNVIGKGAPSSFPTLTTNFAVNSGVDQSDHVAGGSGEPAFVF